MDRTALLSIVEESARLKREFFDAEADSVLEAGRVLAEALRDGKKLLIFGNGGSAADAQHFSAELVNRFRFDRPALPAIALTTDSSILTSIANDSDFVEVFSRQVEALGASGDVAVAISTSGNSPNVLKAVEAARARGLRTLGLAGREGGKLAGQVDLCLTVPHRETSRIQEVHALLIHLFCEMIEDALYPEKSRR
ncbi:MAG: D-sedoheptulose-7-phosphate isomerase [Vicinamibacteria bacterium]